MDITDEVAQRLDEAAQRVADEGTEAEVALLAAMAEVVEGIAPGAAAALVDPTGSEVSRLRAFGVVHGRLLALGPREHAHLLALLADGGQGQEQAA